jgi:hypothetical protein
MAAVTIAAVLVAALHCGGPKTGAAAGGSPRLTAENLYVQLVVDSERIAAPSIQYQGRAAAGEGLRREGAIESWYEIENLLSTAGYAVPSVSLDSNFAFLEFSSIGNSERFSALEVYISQEGHPRISQRVETCYGGDAPDGKRAFTLVVIPRSAIGTKPVVVPSK